MTVSLCPKSFCAGAITGTLVAGLVVVELALTSGSPITSIELLNILAGSASIVLAVVAIGLALYHYDSGKRTEAETHKALAGIQEQTVTLRELSHGHIRYLIRAVTRTSQQMMELMFPVSSGGAGSAEPPPVPPDLADVGGMARADEARARRKEEDPATRFEFEGVTGYLYAYYQMVVANIACQAWMVTVPQPPEWVRDYISSSHVQVRQLTNILGALDFRGELHGNKNRPYFIYAKDTWVLKGWVRDLAATLVLREALRQAQAGGRPDAPGNSDEGAGP